MNDCGGYNWTDGSGTVQKGYQDEMGCSGCNANEYSCESDVAECVSDSVICDGENNCGYYEDEMGCQLILLIVLSCLQIKKRELYHIFNQLFNGF